MDFLEENEVFFIFNTKFKIKRVNSIYIPKNKSLKAVIIFCIMIILSKN